MNTVLIAHYQKDLSWIKEITADVDIKIYSTSDPTKIYVTPNKGMDANMYLRYIIDNYDNLPERTLFVHHHREDWTQDYPLPYYINNLNWGLDDYFNICARQYYKNFHEHYNNSPLKIDQWAKLFDQNWIFDLPKIKLEELIFYVGTQFMCHKKLILQYPKSYYHRLHSWLLLTSLPDEISGRFFEYLWHYILTKNPVDKKYEINQILNI